MNDRRVCTIHDVAREAGVAISTVSKVLNGSTRISQATAERIRAVMARLDYHPNSIARAFVQQSSGTIGVVMEMARDAAFKNPYPYEILGGVEEVLRGNGYLLALANESDPQELRRSLERLTRAKRVDGFILHATQLSGETARYLDECHIAHVVVGEPGAPGRLRTVDSDNRAAGALATAHLLELGRRRPCFIGGPPSDGISAKRVQGFRQALAQAGLAPAAQRVLAIEVSQDNARAAVAALLAAPPGDWPDALVCASNFVAFGALQAIKARGLRVPEDIALIGFDNYPLAPYLDPPLSVVDNDLYELGRQAAQALLDTLRNPGMPPSASLLAPRLLARQSTLG